MRAENNNFKPCPFCGNHEVRVYHDRKRKTIYVWCYVCGAEGPYADNEREAAVFWNARAKLK